jgi:hypothetical protein
MVPVYHSNTLKHSISQTYGHNKQCLMDAMPIESAWKWVLGHDFLAVSVKSWTVFAELPAKIHETNHLHAQTFFIFPLTQHFSSLWT